MKRNISLLYTVALIISIFQASSLAQMYPGQTVTKPFSVGGKVALIPAVISTGNDSNVLQVTGLDLNGHPDGYKCHFALNYTGAPGSTLSFFTFNDDIASSK